MTSSGGAITTMQLIAALEAKHEDLLGAQIVIMLGGLSLTIYGIC